MCCTVNNLIKAELILRGGPAFGGPGFGRADATTIIGYVVFFLKNNGQLVKPGDVVKNPKLVETLKVIAKDNGDGVVEFYRGKIVDDIVGDIKKVGGIVSKSDFMNYEMELRKPLAAHIMDSDFFTMPPPASGGAGIYQMFNILATSVMVARGALWNASIFRAKGKLAWEDVKREYIRKCILWDNDIKSTKHTLKEMIMHYSCLEHAEEKAVNKSETNADLAALNKREMIELAQNAVEFVFADNEVKKVVKEICRMLKEDYCKENQDQSRSGCRKIRKLLVSYLK